MRKLKLQVQLTLDGFVAGPDGQLDWININWDDKLKEYVSKLTDSVATILLGRKMTDGFINYWTNVLKNPDDQEYPFARKMIDYPKYVFTKSLAEHNWINTTLTGQNLVDDVNRIKREAKKDVIVYGGASFVSALIKENLIDEYYLFINPVALGKGLPIFREIKEKQNLNLVNSQAFECGIVSLKLQP